VDATYPIRRDIRLYREEPCVLAFENSLSSVLPIDRTPGSGDPPEKVQMFPLELNVDRVVSLSGMKRLTVPSYDWIAAHRVNPYPPVYFVSYPLFSKAVVRYAPSHDPFVLRFEAIQAAFPDCASKTDHASQVLLHDPIDPNGNPGPWEADTGYRATVRQKGGAFTERTRFDAYDLGAFLQQADGGAQAILWSVDGGGNLIAPPAAAGRHYASCGELDWDHLQVQSQIDLRTATAAGIAVSVGDGAAVPQALIATIEHDGGGFALVLRSMDGAGEHELARSAVTVSGRVTLRLVAFDDVLRASVGELTLEATRGGFREGRVALVAQGPAAFAGILVDSLDIYTFDFVTSRYASFTEHLASYDGQLPTATTGSFGPPPAMGATVFAAHASAIGPLMQPSADPQERQRTFDAVIGALGVGLRKAPSAVSLTRVIDPGGTFALLLESSEAISLTRDVTLTVTRHERVWVPGPIIWPVPIGPLGVLSALQISSSLTLPFASQVKQMARPATYRQAPDENFVLQAARFSAGDVNLEHVTTEWLVTDRIARVVDSPSGKLIQLYMPPSNGFPGLLEETLSADDAAKRPELASLLVAAAGTIGIIHGPNGPIVWGHWEDVDVPVPVVCLSNGAENCVVIFSQNAMPMVSGKYILNYVLERDRWQASTASDPEQHYHQEYEMVLTW
jgi:hypothetical protein